tara:strand:+ start:502 stop:900 length:399 start_codon:yes stop_codon:yes gene_type:complete
MGSIPKIEKFVCESCVEDKMKHTLLNASKDAMKLLPNTGTCPKCKNLVVKTSGCDHIHCTCGAHWCFRCEKQFHDAEDCYEHMESCYGDDEKKKDNKKVVGFLSSWTEKRKKKKKKKKKDGKDDDTKKNRTA